MTLWKKNEKAVMSMVRLAESWEDFASRVRGKFGKTYRIKDLKTTLYICLRKAYDEMQDKFGNPNMRRASRPETPAKRKVGRPRKEKTVVGPTGQPGRSTEFDQGHDKGCLTVRSLDIKTLEDALRVSKVDLKTWEVDHYTINSWETTSVGDDPQTYTNYQVKVWLKRVGNAPFANAMDSIIQKINAGGLQFTRPQKKVDAGDSLLEISLYDYHLGLLAWGRETGDPYDSRLARPIYKNAAVDSIELAKPFGIDRILLVVGQDFFHINNPEALTPKNQNRLDIDTRLQKIYETGIESCTAAVDYCQSYAPVDILWVPGNHDPQTSWYLCKHLEAVYKDNPRVNVDVGPMVRKYYRYGTNLLGFIHGCDVSKTVDLPHLMAAERKEDWAKTTFREWHMGHQHRKRETKYVAGDTYNGVLVRTIPSLSSTDAWHFEKGWVNPDKSAEAYLYDKKEGYTGHFRIKRRFDE